VQTPLAIAARTLGNVTETLDYVPGTLLLPYVTRVLRDLGYGDCQAAVAAGMLQILPATLDIHEIRGLPVPQVLFQHKMGGGFDHQGTIVNRLLEAPPDRSQLKGLRQGYIGVWGDRQLPPYDRVPQVLLTHNTVEDAVQRPTSDVGGVYSRAAIAAGVLLRTELRLHPAVAEAIQTHHATWWEQLNGACRLGVSRKDDYGLGRVCKLCFGLYISYYE
jgi:CRISPR-associated protein Csx10